VRHKLKSSVFLIHRAFRLLFFRLLKPVNHVATSRSRCAHSSPAVGVAIVCCSALGDVVLDFTVCLSIRFIEVLRDRGLPPRSAVRESRISRSKSTVKALFSSLPYNFLTVSSLLPLATLRTGLSLCGFQLFPVLRRPPELEFPRC
jgi:hypothetical protein